MRKVVLYIATSIDNFIARKDGSVDWLDKTPNPNNLDYGYHSFYKSIDTILMGNATYREVLSFDIPFPYPDKTNYVFTRTPIADNSDVRYITGDISAFVKQLKEQQGTDIWLVGGGEINTLLMDHDLIDEIIITRIPTILGEGIPLFAGAPHESELALERLEDFGNGIIQMMYKPKPKSENEL
jgi:dihydrofolate reductase